MPSELGHVISTHEEIAAAIKDGHAFLKHHKSEEVRSFEPDPAVLTRAMVAGWLQVDPPAGPPALANEEESH